MMVTLLHRFSVQTDRNRVVCNDCPWFHHDAALTPEELRGWGLGHQQAASPR